MEMGKQLVSHLVSTALSLMEILQRLAKAYENHIKVLYHQSNRLHLMVNDDMEAIQDITDWETKCYNHQSELMKTIIEYLMYLGKPIKDQLFYNDKVAKIFLQDNASREDMKEVHHRRLILDEVKENVHVLSETVGKNHETETLKECLIRALISMAKICSLQRNSAPPSNPLLQYDVTKDVAHGGFFVEGFDEIDFNDLLQEIGLTGPDWLGETESNMISKLDSLMEVLDKLIKAYGDHIRIQYHSVRGLFISMKKDSAPMSSITEWEIKSYDRQSYLMRSIISYVKNLGEFVDEQVYYNVEVKKTFLQEVEKGDMENVYNRQKMLTELRARISTLMENLKSKNRNNGLLVQSLVSALISMGKQCSLRGQDGASSSATHPGFDVDPASFQDNTEGFAEIGNIDMGAAQPYGQNQINPVEREAAGEQID